METEVENAWKDFLNPAVLRPRIICASLYIATFESLKESIVSRIRDFYCFGLDDHGHKVDPSYKSEILTRSRSTVFASLDWLKERTAIDEADIECFRRVKHCRNVLAHELVTLLSSKGMPPDFESCFEEMAALHKKIEMWWIVEFEIPINPQFDGKDINVNEIVPGPMIALKMLCDIALGDEQTSQCYLDEFRKFVEGKQNVG